MSEHPSHEDFRDFILTFVSVYRLHSSFALAHYHNRFITVFSGLCSRAVHNLHLLLDFGRIEGSVLGSNLGPFAPRSHALLTVPSSLVNQYFYLEHQSSRIL